MINSVSGQFFKTWPKLNKCEYAIIALKNYKLESFISSPIQLIILFSLKNIIFQFFIKFKKKKNLNSNSIFFNSN